MEIYTETLSEAHEAACDVILEQHKEISIQTHLDKAEFTLEYMGPNGMDDCITLHISKPWREPQVSAGSKFGPLFTAAYKKQFLTLTPPRKDGNHATYTYFNRAEDFPYGLVVPADDGPAYLMHGDGKGDGFRQISMTAKKLAADRNSRRGVIVTWNPLLDAESTEPPCMDMIQFIIRDSKLHIRVVFRSQDMLLGLPENLVGVDALLNYMALQINLLLDRTKDRVITGEITLVSLTPHIYKKRDTDDLTIMRKHIFEQKKFGKWKPRITGG